MLAENALLASTTPTGDSRIVALQSLAFLLVFALFMWFIVKDGKARIGIALLSVGNIIGHLGFFLVLSDLQAGMGFYRVVFASSAVLCVAGLALFVTRTWKLLRTQRK